MQENPEPMSRGELAGYLGISRTTLYRYLKKMKIDLPPMLISPKSIVKICICLQYPIPDKLQALAESMEEKGELDKLNM